RAGAVIEGDDGARPQSASDPLQGGEVQGQVQVLLEQEGGGRAAGQKTAELPAIAEAAGAREEDLPRGRPQGELPGPWPLEPAACAIELGAAVLRPAQPVEPG